MAAHAGLRVCCTIPVCLNACATLVVVECVRGVAHIGKWGPHLVVAVVAEIGWTLAIWMRISVHTILEVARPARPVQIGRRTIHSSVNCGRKNILIDPPARYNSLFAVAPDAVRPCVATG